MLALQGNPSSAMPHISLQESSTTMRPLNLNSKPFLPLASTSRALTITGEGPTLGDSQNGNAQSDTNVKADMDDDLSQDDLDDSSQIFADIPLLADDSEGHIVQNAEEQIELWAAVRTVRRKVKQIVDENLSATQSAQPRANLHMPISASSSSPAGTQAAQSDTDLSATMSTSPSNPSKSPELTKHVQQSVIFQDGFNEIFDIPLELILTYSVRTFIVTFPASANVIRLCDPSLQPNINRLGKN